MVNQKSLLKMLKSIVFMFIVVSARKKSRKLLQATLLLSLALQMLTLAILLRPATRQKLSPLSNLNRQPLVFILAQIPVPSRVKRVNSLPPDRFPTVFIRSLKPILLLKLRKMVSAIKSPDVVNSTCQSSSKPCDVKVMNWKLVVQKWFTKRLMAKNVNRLKTLLLKFLLNMSVLFHRNLASGKPI